MNCPECGGEVTERFEPRLLGDNFGPLGKHVMVPHTIVVRCEDCGEVAIGILRLSTVCDLVKFRGHCKN